MGRERCLLASLPNGGYYGGLVLLGITEKLGCNALPAMSDLDPRDLAHFLD